MNGAEVLRDIELLTRIEETKRRPDSSINPEVFAMRSILPILSPRWVDFVKRRMAFDVVHLNEPSVRKSELQAWRAVKSEIKDYIPQVPQDIGSLPSSWRKVFRDVVQLYGDPDGK